MKNIFLILFTLFSISLFSQGGFPNKATLTGNEKFATYDEATGNRYATAQQIANLSLLDIDSFTLINGLNGVEVDTSIIQNKRFVSSFAEMDTLINIPIGSLIRYEPTNAIYKIQTDSILGVENGGFEVREVGSNYAVLQSQNNAFNIKWFGAVGDPNVNENQIFENALLMSRGKELVVSSDSFNLQTAVEVFDNTYIRGLEGATIKGYFFIDGSDNITFDNIKFIKFSEDWNYGIRMQSNAGKNITIKNCEFHETVFYQDLPTGDLASGITFSKNKFYNSSLAELSIVTIQLHADNVLIEDNNFEVYNYDGCIKGSSGTGFFRVEGNNVKGDFLEEFIDVFTNKAPVTFHNNEFDIERGGIFAVKAGTVGDPHPYPYDISVTSNKIRKRRSGNSLIYLSGAFALPFVDSTQVATVSNNTFRLDSMYQSTTPIDVRGFHRVNINNNKNDSEVVFEGTGIYSCGNKYVNINNNTTDGRIMFFASANPSGETYDTILQNGVYNVNNNTITDYNGADQAIYIFNQDSVSLNFNNNDFHAKDDDNIYSIRIVNSEIINGKFNDNNVIISGTAPANADRLEVSSSTFVNFREMDNTWNTSQWRSDGNNLFNDNVGNVAIKMNFDPRPRFGGRW